MTQPITIERAFHVDRAGRGRKKIRQGEPPVAPRVAPGRVPRASKLMALAIRFDGLLRDGIVADQADLARLGHVTRARITQIMNLLLLAPDIQEDLLFLPRIESGSDPLCLRQLQPIAQIADWKKQRRLWKKLRETIREQ